MKPKQEYFLLTQGRQAAGTVDGGARESMARSEAGIIGIEWGSVVASWPRTLNISGDPSDEGEIS